LKTIIPKKEDVTADCLTPSEWCLTRIVKQKHMCPKLTRLAELVLTIPVSNAWTERGLQSKNYKNRLEKPSKKRYVGRIDAHLMDQTYG
jgi:hypothetical protein